MSYPKHPETIVLKNQYYPDGLKEIDSWKYYQSVKSNILNEVNNRDLIFIVMVGLNKPVIIRKGISTNFIRLNSNNYDEKITGRTISIHSTMKKSEDISIIDVDFHDFNKVKEATKDTFDFINNNTIPMIKSASIRFTGKGGFHILCNLDKKYNVDAIRMVLRKVLQQSPLSDKYTIESKRTTQTPNLDLAPNKFRGGFITLYSLSEIGLKCMDIPYSKLMSFDPKLAKV
jgi:hypothetical protein